jgi:hypothetical protein
MSKIKVMKLNMNSKKKNRMRFIFSKNNLMIKIKIKKKLKKLFYKMMYKEINKKRNKSMNKEK